MQQFVDSHTEEPDGEESHSCADGADNSRYLGIPSHSLFVSEITSGATTEATVAPQYSYHIPLQPSELCGRTHKLSEYTSAPLKFLCDTIVSQARLTTDQNGA